MREIIGQGSSLFCRNLALCGWLYVGKLALALMITVPLLIQIQLDLENSRYAQPLLRDWSFAVISELFSNRANLASSLLLFLVCVVLIAFVVKQFLNGGIYAAFLRGEGVERRRFFADGASLFLANIKISFVMGLIYLVLLIPGNFLIKLVPGGLFGHFDNPQAYVAIAKYVVLYSIFALTGILSDFVRLHYTAFPGERVTASFKAGLNFYRHIWVQAIGVYAVYFMPFVICWLLIERLALVVTGGLGNMLGVICELLLFQFCSLLRTSQSLLFVASAASMVSLHSDARYDGAAREAEHD